MKYFSINNVLLVFFCFSIICSHAYGQQSNTAHAQNAMVVGKRNYTSFTAPFINTSEEAIQNNKGFEHHPELGKLFAETPCDNCYELIGKRTENSKTFIKLGTHGKSIMQQTSTAPMHYHDANNNWLTIKTQLKPDETNKGVYAATEQEAPVTINTTNKFVALGKKGQTLQFNNDLELLFEKANGSKVSIGHANWTNYTAGDDGVYVKNAWPGIDIEIFTIRGSVKTNFWINHAMPAYAGGKLLVRDHMQMDESLITVLPGGNVNTSSPDGLVYTGNIEIANKNGDKLFAISAATAFEKNDIKGSLRMLEYYLNGNTLDIALPGNFLNRPAAAYPVVIDPLVSTATVSSVSGSTYSSGWSVGCLYSNVATVPAKVTISDVQFSFQYITSGGALLNNGAFDFKLGSCRSPTPTALFWNCNSLLSGTCTGTGASIFSSLSSCLPAPQCLPYNLNITMGFYQDFLSTPPCSSLYISAGTPLTVTVFGNTIDAGTISASPATLCQGQSTNLSTTASNGVPAYTYTWNPGGATGASVTLTPTVTTTYTVTAADACGDLAAATKTITVNPVLPIAGNTSVCVGATTALSDAITGGTWASGSTAVATIGSSGIVTGVSAGTTTISYTTPTGCSETTTVTVIAPPPSITGIKAVCQGTTTTLSNTTTGGTWMSANTVIATIGSSTGLAAGTAGGTAIITYTASTGCSAVTTLTVNPVSPITGPATICVGGTGTLSNTVSGGTWTSGSSAVATIVSTTGVVSGIAIGTASITYTTPAGCVVTTTVTVNLLTPVTGPSAVCQGSGITLSNATTGGTWASTNTAIATANITAGTITGISGGSAIISYTAPGGCYATTTVTVNPLAAIAGPSVICTGTTATFSDATSGGTWSSTNTAVATMGISSGIATGITTGTSLIDYTTAAGCVASLTLTVTTVLPVTGTTTVCQGSTTTLSDATPSGTWTSGSTTIATVGGATGVVTGASGGTASISYTSSAGCNATTIVTVYPLAPITGASALCVSSTTPLSDAITGGTWSSSNTSAATIDPVTGVVTGVAAGTTVIKYTTLSGCTATTTVLVNALFPITGTTTVCQGSGTILGNLTPSGTWTSSNTTVATINALGVASGVNPGSTTITYTTPGGCYTTTTVTVIPLAPITGVSSLCQGATTVLSDATPGGTWSSSNTAVATIGVSTGMVTALSAGISIMQYNTPSGCVATLVLNVNALAPITGTTILCQGSTTTLSNAVSGGTWISGSPTVATIGISSGTVAGIAGGTSTITYVTPGGCTATITVTINPLSPIAGSMTVCQGYTTTLSDATPGGTWSSSNTAVASISTSGVVTGISNGTTVIQYTTIAGCIATATVTVNPLTPITGVLSFCTNTTLSDATTGGTWSSSNPLIATIGISTGIATAASPGTATVTYTTIGGCFTTVAVTVNPTPPITGATAICEGSTTTLSNTATGGVWSSSNTAIAGIGASSGIVTGVSGGLAIITYTTPAGCVATINVTIFPLGPITGVTTVCQGSATTLSDAATGGTWSSSALLTAPVVVSTGVVTGLTPGTANITYTTAAGCKANTTITVNPLSAITGTPDVCQGLTTALFDATLGGSWTSASTTIATIDATGTVTGYIAGTTAISYTTTSGCIATIAVTVNPISPVTGNTTVCQGYTTTLSDAAPSGTWSTVNPLVATIGVTSGIVSGIAAGTTEVTYVTSAGCIATTTVTVNPLAPITGIASVCAGNTTTFSDATAGGTWSSANTSIAMISGVTGIATGITTGTTAISYTTNLGCTATITLTVDPFPAAISGITSVCLGKTTTLSNSLAGGSWTSSNTIIATVSITTGVVSGLSVNTVIITYTAPGGCAVMTTVTVNPLPLAITGTTSICAGDNTTLSDATPGGLWLSSNPGIATINSVTGGVHGILAGATNIVYTTSSGCTTSTILTVNPVPPAITGIKTVCEGSTATLSNSLSGGSWSSNNPPIASIASTTGMYTGASNGSAIISYTTPAGCFAITPVLVNPTPVIGGTMFTNLTTCVNNDGTITLAGLTPGATYTVNYTFGSTPVIVIMTANASGNIVILNLAKGAYTNFSVTSVLGCTSNVIAGPIVLAMPPAPVMPVASNNTPICAGTDVTLTATDATSGVTYSWSGTGGFTSSAQNPVIASATITASGTYTVTATKLGCVSAPATTVVTIHAVPKITGISYTNPKTCLGTEGTITLSGLVAGTSYAVTYVFNGTPSTVNLIANTTGNIIVTGLSAGTYANITALFSCISNTVGAVTLKDPLPPPTPDLWSNSPICSGNTLRMTATDAIKGVTYEWTGPNSFTSQAQNPVISNITSIDSGIYTLTIKYLNCPTTVSENIAVYPPAKITNITPSQAIPPGSSIQLYVAGAFVYMWTPDNGTLNNPNIDSPIATPEVPTTYAVLGMNAYGCQDSANVTITMDDNITEFVPNAFTPNNDGKDDIFKIGNVRSDRLVEFNIFNRWGQLVYHNSTDPNQGWDGTFNGTPQDIGTYTYNIILNTPFGNNKVFKGSVVLIR